MPRVSLSIDVTAESAGNPPISTVTTYLKVLHLEVAPHPGEVFIIGGDDDAAEFVVQARWFDEYGGVRIDLRPIRVTSVVTDDPDVWCIPEDGDLHGLLVEAGFHVAEGDR